VYVRHYASPPIPTGFIQYDAPYYSANGRAAFQRGNGFAYPNPYEFDAKAPVVYFHWYTWILGFGITRLGLEPGLQYVGIGLLACVIWSWLSLRLVEVVTPDPRFRPALFFLVMWGGGILFLAQALLNIGHGRSLMNDPFAFDPAKGWWFLNWGRNALYPHEAVYHAIAAGTWLAVITRHRVLAVLGCALLATTHPFSGLQLLLMLLAWFGILACIRRDRSNLLISLILTIMLAALLAYYMVYLNMFENHRDVQRFWSGTTLWSHPLTLSVPTLLLAYGPIAVLALLRLVSDRARLPEAAAFFLTCFVVSFFLAKHEWFIPPHQPVHFTRGYVWMPLCLLALPLIQEWLISWRRQARPLIFSMLLLAGAGVAVSDNVAFIGKLMIGNEGFFLTPPEAEMFEWMDKNGLDGVLLCPERDLSYLSATYTAVRPFLGHPTNTPHYSQLLQQVADWRNQGKEGSWFAAIDYILVKRSEPILPLPRDVWEIAFENSELVLFFRKSQDDPACYK
jgi:hypothetical protein